MLYDVNEVIVHMDDMTQAQDVVAFFDFDNTITDFDILDNIIERFAVDEKWIALEEAWRSGEIGSRDCLEGQLKSVRVSRKRLQEYLASIPLNPAFKKIVGLLRKNNIEPVIVSDSFSMIIKQILKNGNVRSIRVFSNELKIRGEEIIPVFPHTNESCRKCGHCKKLQLPRHADKNILYVGDGQSDFCPAKECDLVFAKEALSNYLNYNGKSCFRFHDLSEVYGALEEWSLSRRKIKKALEVA